MYVDELYANRLFFCDDGEPRSPFSFRCPWAVILSGKGGIDLFRGNTVAGRSRRSRVITGQFEPIAVGKG